MMSTLDTALASVTTNTQSPVLCLHRIHVLLCLQGVTLCSAESRCMAWTTQGNDARGLCGLGAVTLSGDVICSS